MRKLLNLSKTVPKQNKTTPRLNNPIALMPAAALSLGNAPCVPTSYSAGGNKVTKLKTRFAARANRPRLNFSNVLKPAAAVFAKP